MGRGRRSPSRSPPPRRSPSRGGNRRSPSPRGGRSPSRGPPPNGRSRSRSFRGSASPPRRGGGKRRRRRRRNNQSPGPSCSGSRSPRGGRNARSPSRYTGAGNDRFGGGRGGGGAVGGNVTATEACKDFIRGECTRGDQCRYRHTPIERRSRSRKRRRSPSRRGGRGGRSKSPADRRPQIEREKGGVKLFVGRLPREATQSVLKDCFEEFGEVLEVFVIDSKAMSNVGCAFIRMGTIDAAEKAIEELHEQRVLIPEQRDLGPMQVAFAKGEAVRLGLEEREEILPSFKEARMKVVEHQEKRMFFEAMQKQQEAQQEHMQKQQQLQVQAAQVMAMPKEDLVNLIKDGQRHGGNQFKQKWWTFADRGWQGMYDHDPARHPQQTLAQFASIACFDYGHESWFKKHFENLPPLPPGTPLPLPPFPMPPPPMPGAGGPGGLPPPPFPPGMPGMMPGMPPGMPFPPGMGPPPGMMPPGMMPPGMGGPGMGMPGMPPMVEPPRGHQRSGGPTKQDGGGDSKPPPAPPPPAGDGGGGRGGGGGGGNAAANKEISDSESESESAAIDDINADDI